MSLRRAGSRARNRVAGSPCGVFRCWHPKHSMPRPPTTAGRERSDDQTDNSADTELGQGRHGASSVFCKIYDSSSTARRGVVKTVLARHASGPWDHTGRLQGSPVRASQRSNRPPPPPGPYERRATTDSGSGHSPSSPAVERDPPTGGRAVAPPLWRPEQPAEGQADPLALKPGLARHAMQVMTLARSPHDEEAAVA